MKLHKIFIIIVLSALNSFSDELKADASSEEFTILLSLNTGGSSNSKSDERSISLMLYNLNSAPCSLVTKSSLPTMQLVDEGKTLIFFCMKSHNFIYVDGSKKTLVVPNSSKGIVVLQKDELALLDGEYRIDFSNYKNLEQIKIIYMVYKDVDSKQMDHWCGERVYTYKAERDSDGGLTFSGKTIGTVYPDNHKGKDEQSKDNYQKGTDKIPSDNNPLDDEGK